MVWEKLATTTLESDGDTVDTDTITVKTNNAFVSHDLQSGNIGGLNRINSDTGSNYASRFAIDGGSEWSLGTQPYWYSDFNPSNPYDIYGNGIIQNVANEEKLQCSFFVKQIGTGSSQPPSYQKHVGKYVTSPESDMSSFQMVNIESGDFVTDSNLTLFGTD